MSLRYRKIEYQEGSIIYDFIEDRAIGKFPTSCSDSVSTVIDELNHLHEANQQEIENLSKKARYLLRDLKKGEG